MVFYIFFYNNILGESGSEGEDDDDAELTLEERLKKIMKDPIQVHSGDEGGASPEPEHNEPAKPGILSGALIPKFFLSNVNSH